MNLSELSNIPVSNSPHTNLERIVTVDGFWPDFKNNKIEFYMTVYTKDLNGDVMGEKGEIPPYEKITYASDAELVNAETGEYVGHAADIEDQTGLVGEYTFFTGYASGNISLYPILYSKVLQADALGKINRP